MAMFPWDDNNLDDEDLTEEPEDIDSEADDSASSNAASSAGEGAFDSIKNRISDAVRKQSDNPLWKRIWNWIKKHIIPTGASFGVLVVFVISIIGLISFILNAPAFFTGKIDEIVSGIVQKLEDGILGKNYRLSADSIDHEDRLKLLNYISSDLGFDVIGFGFVPTATYETGQDSSTGEYKEGKQIITDYNPNIGFTGINNDKNPDTDLLYYYLMANERSYVINDGDSRFSLKEIWDNPFKALWEHKDEQAWTGMLNIEGFGNNRTDDPNPEINGIVDVSVDRENQLLKISNKNGSFKNGLLNKDKYSFSLEGWTGRYGKPIEFSLALHIASMSSGLSKEMITNKDLQTEVFIGLQKLKCDLNFKFTTKNGEQINIPYNPPKGQTPMDFANAIVARYDEDPNFTLTENDELYNSISIRGILAVADNNIGKNRLPESKIEGEYSGISRHTDTLAAILGNNNFAVITDCSNYNNRVWQKDNAYHIYEVYMANSEWGAMAAYNQLKDSYEVFTEFSVGEQHSYTNLYSLTSGAYLCSYDSTNAIDEKSGKISAIQNQGYAQSDYSKDREGARPYTLYYKFEKASGDRYYYRVYMKIDGKEIPLEYRMVIPKVGSKEIKVSYTEFEGYQKSNGPDETTISVATGLGNLLEPSAPTITNDLINAMPTLARVSRDRAAYLAMFKEIDWYLYVLQNYGSSIAGINNLNYSCSHGSNIEDSYYYTRKLNEVLDDLDNSRIQDGYDKLLELLNELNDDYKKLKSFETESAKFSEVINTMLEQSGYPGLTVEQLQKINDVFFGNADAENGSVDYTQPYIKWVIKHWFKDVVYTGLSTGKTTYNSVYSKVQDEFELNYTGEEFTDIQVSAVLKPQGENDYYYKQEKQPYVVKGQYIMQDGEVQEIVEDGDNVELLDENGNKVDIGDYHLGDGYRATKKIFTQGMYYTFNGSAETAKSIFWEQQLEKFAHGQVYVVSTLNGNIYTVTPIENATVSETPQSVDLEDSGLSEELISYAKTYVKYIGTWTKDAGTDSDETIGMKGERYLLTIPADFEYISPTENSYSDVQKRVERINSIWTAMKVVNLRKHISFDNVTTEGEVVANSGLSILKNCNTKDADFVYRDLKELLIELGYYTEAEFDELDTKLKWFIPSYRPKTWPQNVASDFKIAAVTYPYEAPSEEETEKKEKLSIEVDKSDGVKEGLNVVAPGDCRIIRVLDGEIEIEFDGVSQPEISAYNGYKMTIQGINISPSTLITSVDAINDSRVTKTAQAWLDSKDTIKQSSVLGTTGTEIIYVILKNDIGRPLSNVGDYMSPDKISWDELAYFYWVPYESGGDPGIVANPSDKDEIAVGLVQWTSYGDLNNVRYVCEKLVEKDPGLCAPLQQFTSWSVSQIVADYRKGSESQLVRAFREITDNNREAFAQLQLEIALEDKMKLVEANKYKWILDKNAVTVGTLFSVLNYAPGIDWDKATNRHGEVINPSMSDEEIIWALMNRACEVKSTAGDLSHRWTTQFELAMDLIHGTGPYRDFDMEGFVFGTKNYRTYYENGRFPNSLANF